MDPSAELKQAADALKIGTLVEAPQPLDHVITFKPDNAEAWQMLLSAVKNDFLRVLRELCGDMFF